MYCAEITGISSGKFKLSRQAKRVDARQRWQYAEADRKGKTEIADAVVAATGYHRKYVLTVLRKPEKRLRVLRKPRKIYNESVKETLVLIWNAANQICSKRLAPFLSEFIETLERFGHLNVSSDVKEKLLSLSPATIDRLLRDERSRHPRGKSTTKPGNLLKQRIKIRTFAEWNESGPGFFEGDLVAHCGDHVDGNFLNSLVLTDIASCWMEFAPLLRKSDADVIAAMTAIRGVLPIPLLGLDTDNGSEFINNELFDYCEREKITFTRSRPYKKNDHQAHVEQKNGNVVRRAVGYDRFEGEEAWKRLLKLYRALRLYVNFFQPTRKLLKKVRTGSRVSKKYDKAQTPYKRLLDSEHVSNECKSKLTELYITLDPVALFEEIGELQADLLSVAADYIDVQPDKIEPLAPQKAKEERPVAALNMLKPLNHTKRAYRKRRRRAEIAAFASREAGTTNDAIPRGDTLADSEHQQLNVNRNAVRGLHEQGMSARAIAKELDMSRNTVTKYIRNSDAPKYRFSKPRSKPLCDRWRAKVEEMLGDEKDRSGTQFYTARQICKRLAQQGYSGSERTVRKLVADIRQAPCKKTDTAHATTKCRQILVTTNPLAPNAASRI